MFQPKWYKSREWIRRRNEVIAAVGVRCEGCGRGEESRRLQVHHLEGYTSKEEFLAGPYEVLCFDCHQAVHSPGRNIRQECRAAAMEVTS